MSLYNSQGILSFVGIFSPSFSIRRKNACILIYKKYAYNFTILIQVGQVRLGKGGKVRLGQGRYFRKDSCNNCNFISMEEYSYIRPSCKRRIRSSRFGARTSTLKQILSLSRRKKQYASILFCTCVNQHWCQLYRKDTEHLYHAFVY